MSNEAKVTSSNLVSPLLCGHVKIYICIYILESIIFFKNIYTWKKLCLRSSNS
jgi:hypothetical protein